MHRELVPNPNLYGHTVHCFQSAILKGSVGRVSDEGCGHRAPEGDVGGARLRGVHQRPHLSGQVGRVHRISVPSKQWKKEQASRCFTADVCLRQSVTHLKSPLQFPNQAFSAEKIHFRWPLNFVHVLLRSNISEIVLPRRLNVPNSAETACFGRNTDYSYR